MRKTVLMSFIAAAFLLFLQTDAFSCGCPSFAPSHVDIKLRADEAKAAFSGEVIDIVERAKDRQVTFKVAEFWNGDVGPRVTVSTDKLNSSCAYDFEIGKRYLVFAHLWEDALYTGACSRNRELEQAGDELKVLGKGKTPVKKKSEGS